MPDSPFRTRGGVNRDAGTLARISRPVPGSRLSVSALTPKPWLVTSPGKVSASQPKLSPFAASEPAPLRAGPSTRIHRPKGRVKLGREATVRAPGQNPLLLFNSLRRSRSHTRGIGPSPLIT